MNIILSQQRLFSCCSLYLFIYLYFVAIRSSILSGADPDRLAMVYRNKSDNFSDFTDDKFSRQLYWTISCNFLSSKTGQPGLDLAAPVYYEDIPVVCRSLSPLLQILEHLLHAVVTHVKESYSVFMQLLLGKLVLELCSHLLPYNCTRTSTFVSPL